jgi:hypothetical protein
MHLSMLLNPTVRVYTLRLLLMDSIFTIIYANIASGNIHLQPAFACSSFILLHHILVYVKCATLN